LENKKEFYHGGEELHGVLFRKSSSSLKKLIFFHEIPIMILELRKMIHGIITNNPVPSIGFALNASTRGKISIPVEPVSLVYSHFKHVSGVPAPEGSAGVAISRLNILDILIDQMKQIKKTETPIISAQIEDKLDALIEAYKNQVFQAAEAHSKMPYVPVPLVQTGAVVNLMI
jgi:hypothetical protein